MRVTVISKWVRSEAKLKRDWEFDSKAIEECYIGEGNGADDSRSIP
jgi:hypothetical protein